MRQGSQALVTTRKLSRRFGVEGAAHDPYGFTEYETDTNGIIVCAHMGLGCWLSVRERGALRPVLKVKTEPQVLELFALLTGFDLSKFDRYYERAHPYSEIEDPMGNPSDYI